MLTQLETMSMSAFALYTHATDTRGATTRSVCHCHVRLAEVTGLVPASAVRRNCLNMGDTRAVVVGFCIASGGVARLRLRTLLRLGD